jgi:hypothetical protein
VSTRRLAEKRLRQDAFRDQVAVDQAREDAVRGAASGGAISVVVTARSSLLATVFVVPFGEQQWDKTPSNF